MKIPSDIKLLIDDIHMEGLDKKITMFMIDSILSPVSIYILITELLVP